MSDNKKNEGVIYRCPICLGALNDVTIDMDENGIYRCMKCGYNGDLKELMEMYAQFRARYKLRKVRLTLEDQREM